MVRNERSGARHEYPRPSRSNAAGCPAELAPMGGVPDTRAICASAHRVMDDSESLTSGSESADAQKSELDLRSSDGLSSDEV